MWNLVFRKFLVFALLSTSSYALASANCCFSIEGEIPPRDFCCPDKCEEECRSYLISADYILWYVRESGLMVAASQFANTEIVLDESKNISYPKFKLQSGFKVGLGLGYDRNCWDVFVQYTWFSNRGNPLLNANLTAAPTTGAFVVPAWAINNIPGTMTMGDPPIGIPSSDPFALQSSWNNFFNELVGTLGQKYCVEGCFSMTPRFGVLGWWNSQTFLIVYEVKNNIYYVNASQDAQGVGPYFVQEVDFYIYDDGENKAGLWGKWGGALLWSRFKANVLVTWDQPAATVIDQVRQKSLNKFYITAPMLEVSLGLRWETCASENRFSCDPIWYRIQAGWELSAWFDQNHIISNLIAIPTGTCDALYIMQGLTIGIQVGF